MVFGIFVLIYISNQKDDELNIIIERLVEYSKLFHKMIVVDNSDINNCKIIKKRVPNVYYHFMNGNFGISEALNYAFQWANYNKIDYLLTMDQDSIYPNTEIKKMMNYIEQNDSNKHIGIYAANYRRIYYKNEKKLYTTPAIGNEETKHIKFAMTSGSYVNIKYVQKALPLQNYFVSYVDIDLCAWFHENGYDVIQIGESLLDQQVGNEVKATKYNMFFHILNHSETRYYFMTRNNYYFCSKHSKYKYDAKKRLARIYINILIGEKGKMKKFGACYKGYKDYKRGIMGNIPYELNN